MSETQETETAEAIPTAIMITRKHSFIDDAGVNHEWPGGTVVTDAADIALLMERKATFEVV